MNLSLASMINSEDHIAFQRATYKGNNQGQSSMYSIFNLAMQVVTPILLLQHPSILEGGLESVAGSLPKSNAIPLDVAKRAVLQGNAM